MILAFVRINRFLKYSMTMALGEVEFDCDFPDGELHSESRNSTSSADGLLGGHGWSGCHWESFHL